MESLWLKQGAYAAPARIISSGIRACTHLAHVSVGGTLQTAYVKAFPRESEKCLFNEAVGSSIARVAGIGAPAGGLLWLPASLLGSLFPHAAFIRHEDHVLCWASLPVNSGYGIAEVGLADSVGLSLEAVKRHLLGWIGLGPCTAFDSWVANTDRHANNVLLAGGGLLVPIDHSDCFGGYDWHPLDFKQPDRWYTNRLLEETLAPPEALPLPTKAALMAAADRLHMIFANSRSEIASFAPWLGDPTGLDWLTWLEHRSQLVVAQLRDRVRMVI